MALAFASTASVALGASPFNRSLTLALTEWLRSIFRKNKSMSSPDTPTIPADLLPRDGRFGSGPSKIRPEQIAALLADALDLPGHVAPTGHGEEQGRRSSRGTQLRCSLCPRDTKCCSATVAPRASGTRRRFISSTSKSQHLSFGEFSSKFASAAQGGAAHEGTVRSSRATSARHPDGRSPMRAWTSTRSPTTRRRPA